MLSSLLAGRRGWSNFAMNQTKNLPPKGDTSSCTLLLIGALDASHLPA